MMNGSTTGDPAAPGALRGGPRSESGSWSTDNSESFRNSSVSHSTESSSCSVVSGQSCVASGPGSTGRAGAPARGDVSDSARGPDYSVPSLSSSSETESSTQRSGEVRDPRKDASSGEYGGLTTALGSPVLVGTTTPYGSAGTMPALTPSAGATSALQQRPRPQAMEEHIFSVIDHNDAEQPVAPDDPEDVFKSEAGHVVRRNDTRRATQLGVESQTERTLDEAHQCAPSRSSSDAVPSPEEFRACVKVLKYWAENGMEHVALDETCDAEAILVAVFDTDRNTGRRAARAVQLMADAHASTEVPPGGHFARLESVFPYGHRTHRVPACPEVKSRVVSRDEVLGGIRGLEFRRFELDMLCHNRVPGYRNLASRCSEFDPIFAAQREKHWQIVPGEGAAEKPPIPGNVQWKQLWTGTPDEMISDLGSHFDKKADAIEDIFRKTPTTRECPPGFQRNLTVDSEQALRNYKSKLRDFFGSRGRMLSPVRTGQSSAHASDVGQSYVKEPGNTYRANFRSGEVPGSGIPGVQGQSVVAAPRAADVHEDDALHSALASDPHGHWAKLAGSSSGVLDTVTAFSHCAKGTGKGSRFLGKGAVQHEHAPGDPKRLPVNLGMSNSVAALQGDLEGRRNLESCCANPASERASPMCKTTNFNNFLSFLLS